MLTIITPTYNRKKLLSRLYTKLKDQTIKDFEWIIIDDGSEDQTEIEVNKWINEKKIRVIYEKQENQGKYIAHNRAVKLAKGNFIVCIDSDDYPTNTFVEKIKKFSKKIESEKYAGIVALKIYKNKKIIGKKLELEKETTVFQLSKEKFGDKVLIYKTEILKKNLFPEIIGTKFLTEDIIYNKIDQNYKMLTYPEKLCICEYQNDGYSNNFFEIMMKNPVGFQIYYLQRIDMENSLIQKSILYLKYEAFKKISKNNTYRYKGIYKNFFKVMMPLTLLVHIYYLIKWRKNKWY